MTPKIKDGKIVITRTENMEMFTSPGSNLSLKYKRQIRRLKTKLKEQGIPIKYLIIEE